MSTIPSETQNAIDRREQSEAIVKMLADPRSYFQRPSRVECIETHISWVFLTDRFVYKLKKPVRYDFLDFSTPALRRQACQDEVRLNRRLAAEIYLGVVPISKDSRGSFHLGVGETPVDWVVKMRRLPAERALDQLIESDQLTSEEIARLASALADFYQRLPPVTVKVDQYRQRVEKQLMANRRELLHGDHGFSASLVKRVHAAQLGFLRMVPELLDERVCDGRIVEGHGDLRPEHVYLNPHPVVIDCIEFNAELCQIDVVDELGFFAMECDYLGAGTVGQKVIDRYCRQNGDAPSAELLSFYKSYRACVRAKVLALRAQQTLLEEKQEFLDKAGKYLDLADSYASEFARPLLIVVRGLTGTGKSTLAAALAESLGIDLLQTDAIRQEIFGPADGSAKYNEDRYRPENRERVYREMLRLAGENLSHRLGVLLDGTFLSASLRSEVVSLAQQYGATALIVNCRCPDEVAVQRIADRIAGGQTLSEARPELFRYQQQEEEPFSPSLPILDIDTTGSLPVMTESVFARLRRQWIGEQETEFAKT